MSSKKMFTREAVETIVIHRDGEERQTINPGQVFDFTEEELAQIDPNAVSEKSVVSLDEPNGVDLKKVTTKKKANETKAPNTKGKANDDDDI